MSDRDPHDLPKLPPIRESAEHVLPPLTAEPSGAGWETAEAQPAQESPAAERPRAARERSRRESREPAARPQSERSVRPEREQPPADPPAGSRRRPRTEDGRRFSTAGSGLVVALLALLFGSLLNAPGMHKASFNRQPGTGRDVALALTGGLAGISGALQFDRPRQLVQSATGRSGEDEINVAIVVPPTTVDPRQPGTKTPTTTPPGKIAFTPQRKLRLWVAGDSLVITPGYSIVRAAGGSPVIESVGGIDGHIATGLTRPDVFNWFEEIRTQVKKLRPTVVVLNFGGNDDKAYMTGLREGTSIGDFGGPSWTKEYRRRVAGVMDIVNRAGATVVWLGLPITSSADQTQRFDTINAIVQKIAKARPGKAIFIDTYTMFAGDTGGYTEFLENARGDSVKVRAGDGVHFDPPGGDIIAREVLKRLNEQFDLTSWRNKTS